MKAFKLNSRVLTFSPPRSIFIFAVTFVVSFVTLLPTANLPTAFDLYHAVVIGLPVAVLGAFGSYYEAPPKLN